jgi:hypothetical protein
MEYKIHDYDHSSDPEELEKIMNIYASEGFEYVGNIIEDGLSSTVSKLIFKK